MNIGRYMPELVKRKEKVISNLLAEFKKNNVNNGELVKAIKKFIDPDILYSFATKQKCWYEVQCSLDCYANVHHEINWHPGSIFTEKYLKKTLNETLDKIDFPELKIVVLGFKDPKKVVELAENIKDEELKHTFISQFITIQKGKHVWKYSKADGKFKVENLKKMLNEEFHLRFIEVLRRADEKVSDIFINNDVPIEHFLTQIENYYVVADCYYNSSWALHNYVGDYDHDRIKCTHVFYYCNMYDYTLPAVCRQLKKIKSIEKRFENRDALEVLEEIADEYGYKCSSGKVRCLQLIKN